MNRHELLLLAHGAEEAERVRAEADQADGRNHGEAHSRGGGHPQALAPPLRREHEERQQ